MARVILAAVAAGATLVLAASAAAQPAASDRTVQYCSDLVGTAATQRNAMADQVVQLQAQLAMAQRDRDAALAQVVALTPRPAPPKAKPAK